LSATWETASPQELVTRTAAWLSASPGIVRVAVDGPASFEPAGFADSLLDPLRALGRPPVHLRSSSFWRDASLRLELGRDDWQSYLTWLDAGALQREVLEAVVTRGTYLPSLRDPASNRSTREPARALAPQAVLLVSGEFLLGAGLAFDRTIHLETSAAARGRRTPDDRAWTLPAYDAYERDVRPAEQADVVIRFERRHPVVRGLA
jgi:hypothetical protein